MFKRKIITLSAIMIAGLMTFQANVSADAVAVSYTHLTLPTT